MGQVKDRSRQLQYLEAMGIQAWQPRHVSSQPSTEVVPEHAPEVVAPQASGAVMETRQGPALSWEALEDAVRNCEQCELCRQRTQSVFGVGNRNAEWMVIGEAPGADEDKQGEPFVGRAGQLLNKMLQAIGLKREAVYITNIVKCRPPQNRDPRPEEAMSCEGYLKQQIALVKPKIILAVGRIAAHNLLKTDQKVGAMRGQRFTYENTGIPVIVTYHPAYLLRSPGEKRKAWDDLLLARQIVSAGSIVLGP